MNDIPVFKFALREDLKEDKQFLPTRGTPKSTGWDVKAAWEDKQYKVVSFGEYIKIPLGFRTFAPSGWWYELKPRSSTFGKKKLHSLYGTIDEDYEGQLIFACQYLPRILFGGLPESYNLIGDEVFYSHGGLIISEKEAKLTIDFGEAIGQIIPVKRQEMFVVDVSNTEIDALYSDRNAIRGAGGFGSTSK